MPRKRAGDPSKPWARANAKKRILSPDERWADEICAKLDAACHPWQLDAVNDPGRRVSLLVGRGGGKTTALRVRALKKLVRKPRARVIYFATTRGQAEDLNWNPLKEMLDILGLTDDFELTESKLRCTCRRTGAVYRMYGADDKGEIEKHRGKPFDEVQVDEAASHGDLLEYLADRIVGPRLGERGGCIVLAGTPGHVLRGMFYEATRPGSEQHRAWTARKDHPARWLRWSSHAWTNRDVVELPKAKKRYPALVANWAEALLEKEAKQWSDDHPIWLREYLGIWAEDNTETVFRYRAHVDGAPWNRWRPFGERRLEGLAGLREAIARLPTAELGHFMHVVAMDMGHSDPFACNVLSFAPRDQRRRIWHTFAFEKTAMYAKPIAELLIGADLKPMAPDGIFGVIGWPVGIVMDADLAVIEELANVYGVRCKKAERRMDYKMGAIELVNGDLVEGPRIVVIEDSPLEKQLQQLQWKMDDNGRPRENKAQANHSSDTLIYGRLEIAHLFDSGIVSAEKPPAPYADPQGLGGAAQHEYRPKPPPTPYESDRAPGAYEDPFA